MLWLDPHYNSISSLYTNKRRNAVITQEIPKIIETGDELQWILAQPYVYKNNAKEIREKTIQLYIAAYSNTWSLILTHLKFTTPQSLYEAQQLLDDILSPHSSLLSLLKTLHQETNFQELNQLTIPLAALNSLLNYRNQVSPSLQEILKQIAELNDQLLIILDAANPHQAAFEFSRNKLNQQNKGTINLIDVDALQEPARTWFSELSTKIWELLVKESISYLQSSSSSR